MSGPDAITVEADLGGGARGFLVIDSTVHDGSSGGLRVATDLTVAEVAALAREMTLKFAFIGRASGGAKGGLRLPAGASVTQKRAWLRELGCRLGPLLRRGVYLPGTDLNCDREDLAEVYAGAGLELGAVTDTAAYTAMGVAAALAACRDALGAEKVRLAIEGFGGVAAALAGRLPADAFTIVAVSTACGSAFREEGFSPGALVEARARHGEAFVRHLDAVRGEPASLFSSDVDVFVPSARTWSIGRERARTLRARLVAPIANAPYASGAVDVLESRGVRCLPGFVVNSGGIFGSSLVDSGAPRAAVEALTRTTFRAIVGGLLAAADRHGCSPSVVAEEVALARLARRAAAPSAERAYRRALRIAVRRHAPRRVYGWFYLRSFTSNLAELQRQIASWDRRIVQRPTGS